MTCSHIKHTEKVALYALHYNYCRIHFRDQDHAGDGGWAERHGA